MARSAMQVAQGAAEAKRGRRNPEEGRQAFSRMEAGHPSEPRIIAAARQSGARRAPKSHPDS